MLETDGGVQQKTCWCGSIGSGTFDLENFIHLYNYNVSAGRIEMHLVCRKSCLVKVVRWLSAFAAGSSMHTEHFYNNYPQK